MAFDSLGVTGVWILVSMAYDMLWLLSDSPMLPEPAFSAIF